jgi:hypothetical protein
VEVSVKKIATAIVCVTVAAAAVSACSTGSAPAAGAGTGGASTAAADAKLAGAAIAPAAAHAQAPGAAGGAGQGASQGFQTVTGTVLETMDAVTYTYVRVKTDKGDVWAATSQFKVAVGDKVVVPLEMPMENFRSNALKRDFPLIFFATRITKEGEAPAAESAIAAMGGALPPGHSPTGPARATVTEVIPQPAGGTAVAALWTNRKTLAGKLVTVRGKVVKFNGGILGKNWFHLQDGTGTEKDGTNDIPVTSAAETKVGDIVTITGTLDLDKDFGSGYAYAVIIEDAKIVPAK